MSSNVVIRFKKLRPEAVLPTKHTPSDAGFDLSCVEAYTLKPGETHAFVVGLASEVPVGWYCQVRGRSSLARWGVDVLGGVIDASFRGEWKVVLTNGGNVPHEFKVGHRVAQFTVHECPVVEIIEADELGESDRGDRGFGSSGR